MEENMETAITNKNIEKAIEVLSRQFIFDDIVELGPNQYPKGAEKKAGGEEWSLWSKDGLNYAVVLGVGVFLVVQ